MKTIPKTWVKTDYEIAGIWNNIESAALGLPISASQKDLYALNRDLERIVPLVRKLERAQVAKALKLKK